MFITESDNLGMNDKKFTSAIILAAGMGSRMKSDITKQRMQIRGHSVLLRSASAFQKAETIDEIIVVCREDELDFAKSELSILKKPVKYVTGGKTRKESAKCGISAVSENAEFVAIHDAARCLVSSRDIELVARAAYEFGAATASTPIIDTIKSVGSDGKIINTINRSTLRAVQTPQAFSYAIYKKAIEAYRGDYSDITDDNMRYLNELRYFEAFIEWKNLNDEFLYFKDNAYEKYDEDLPFSRLNVVKSKL